MNKQMNQYDYLGKKTSDCSTCVFFIHAPCFLMCILFMSLLFDYMCMRLPFIPWSIAGVPSSQALPGFLISAPPSVLVPVVLGALAGWI